MRLLLLSTSTVHGGTYLGYAKDWILDHFAGCQHLAFVPYARPGGRTHDAYTAIARQRLQELGFRVTGVHEQDDPAAVLQEADGVFVGGGNTFVLLNELYATGLIDTLRQRVQEGLPYMGSSAGINITGLTIGTTNDMPIVYPPSFQALGLLPFNINPHYLDPLPDSTHMGETRELRIQEFHTQNAQPVVGLREGSALHYVDNSLKLLGPNPARVFMAGQQPTEWDTNADWHGLLGQQ